MKQIVLVSFLSSRFFKIVLKSAAVQIFKKLSANIEPKLGEN